MTQQETYSDSARDAYDAFARIYDEFNAQNDHELWVGKTLLPELEKHGLRVGRVLDVGCGTGKAFPPLLDRGWEIYGCDISPAMLRQARREHPDVRQGLYSADARDLPEYRKGPFDLILLLNDVVNYLTEDGDLERCFGGVERNLAPGGLVCFDVNTLGLMRSNFEGPLSESMSRGKWEWRGQGQKVAAGGTFEAELSGPGVESHVHRQRHWTDEEIRGALEVVGLTCFARLGQREKGDRIILSEDPDEERDAKVIYIGGRCE